MIHKNDCLVKGKMLWFFIISSGPDPGNFLIIYLSSPDVERRLSFALAFTAAFFLPASVSLSQPLYHGDWQIAAAQRAFPLVPVGSPVIPFTGRGMYYFVKYMVHFILFNCNFSGFTRGTCAPRQLAVFSPGYGVPGEYFCFRHCCLGIAFLCVFGILRLKLFDRVPWHCQRSSRSRRYCCSIWRWAVYAKRPMGVLNRTGQYDRFRNNTIYFSGCVCLVPAKQVSPAAEALWTDPAGGISLSGIFKFRRMPSISSATILPIIQAGAGEFVASHLGTEDKSTSSLFRLFDSILDLLPEGSFFCGCKKWFYENHSASYSFLSWFFILWEIFFPFMDHRYTVYEWIWFYWFFIPVCGCSVVVCFMHIWNKRQTELFSDAGRCPNIRENSGKIWWLWSKIRH